MNKFYKLLVIAAIGSGSIISSAKAQAVEQGNILIDTYYGFPNLTSSLIKSVTTSTDVKVTTLGPVGGKFEYMVSDNMGVGFESNYSSTTAEYTEESYDSFDDTTYIYDYTYQITSLRFMPRFNIHFGSSDSFDGYFGIAAGYLSRKYTYETNNANYSADGSVSNPVPFAMRLAVGGRYYFTNNLGIHMEFGLGGGALIHAGASFKF